MKKIKKFICLIALLYLPTKNVLAQSVTDATIKLDGAATTFIVVLGDTVNVNEIETVLGTGQGLNDVFSYAFTYDVSAGLPNGYSYLRVGNKLILGISTLIASDSYFGTVRIKNSTGNWSQAYNFVTN